MKLIKSLLALGLILFFTGCTQNQPSINSKITDPHIIMENGSMDGWLEFQTVNYLTREDGLMEVEARFRNYSSFDKTVAYKINWMDKNNFIEKSILSKWVVVEIQSQRGLTIHGISPSNRIKDFQILIQETSTNDDLRKNSYHKEYTNN